MVYNGAVTHLLFMEPECSIFGVAVNLQANARKSC